MPKQKLFDEESDEEVSLKTENDYAKKYDAWREKEEIHKLEQKYGSKALSSDASVSSDSEDESDEPPEVSEETEAQFLKTLALLKTKDPRIYDPDFKFFDDKDKELVEKPVSKTLTFDDSDSDEDDGNIFTIEKKAEINVDKEQETSEKSSKMDPKEGKLKEYLTGKAEQINQEVERDLAPLKALWSDPKLNDGEAFLRDYILNKEYLEEDDIGQAEDKILDDEDLEEDERRVEEQGQFERAYNFRFEEPDDEYVKRFPRTMNYIRPKDERRSRKRAELRARKDEEKGRKMDEIARLKALKLKEIQQKIARIKEVTGNQELAFKEADIEGDFDPEEHDRRMRALFDEQYYGEADDQKPVFPDLDDELEIENWDNFDPDTERVKSQDSQELNNEDGPHCEDDGFNMDADYDPKQARANLLEELKRSQTKKRRNRRKKSKLAALLSSEKPKFIPETDKSYSEYMEEYYKMDCEDVIGGDLPTRFKYRQVVPNDFGLTIEEILLADDRELTQWVPLKKIVKHRPTDVERSEINTYAQKAADVNLKRKVLPSLFNDLPEEPELVVPVEETGKKKKKKKKNKDKTSGDAEPNEEHNFVESITQNDETRVDDDSQVNTKKKKKKHRDVEGNVDNLEETFDNSEVIPKKKNKHKETDNNITNLELNNIQTTSNVHEKVKKKKRKEIESNVSNFEANGEENIATKEGNRKKKKHKADGFIVENILNVEPSSPNDTLVGTKVKKNKHSLLEVNAHKGNLKRKLESNDTVPNNKMKNKNSNPANAEKNPNKRDFKKNFKHNDKFRISQGKEKPSDDPLSKLSDERLRAYGLNPKKYRNFLKHKKF